MKWSVKNRRADFRVRNDSRWHRVRLDRLEALESRQLLTTTSYTFVAPDLSTLEHQANPTAAMFNRLVGSLQAQIVVGPLSALQYIGGVTTSTQKINGNQYVAAAANMVQGFEAAATQQEPSNQKLDHLVQLQGAALDAQTVALNAKRNDNIKGFSDMPVPGNTSLFYNANLMTVEHLTLSRPLWPYGTPILDYINRTELFETDLATAVISISGSVSMSIPTLGIAAAANLAQIEAASFTADINLSTLQRPGLDTFMNEQVGTLLTQFNAAAQSGPSGAAAFAAAVQSFTTATYDQTTGAGYLGPRGAYGRYFVQPTTLDQIPSAAYANVSFTPPFPYSTGNTFAYGRYKAKQLHKTTTYHRNFAGLPTLKGSFVTTVLYPNSAVAIRKTALDQTFLPPTTNFNTTPATPAYYGSGLPNAFYVQDVVVPAGHWVFVGRVAPIYQGVLTPRNTLYPGLGPQIVPDNPFASNVSYVNLRTTGT